MIVGPGGMEEFREGLFSQLKMTLFFSHTKKVSFSAAFREFQDSLH